MAGELDHILTNSLSAAGMDYLLSEYLSNRYNMTVWRLEGVIVRLDPNTVGPVFSSLISVIEQKTDYRPGTDPDFRLFKANKKHYMVQFLTIIFQDGLGKLSHQATPFSMAELHLAIQSGHMDLYEAR